jgi:hypothetical protein
MLTEEAGTRVKYPPLIVIGIAVLIFTSTAKMAQARSFELEDFAWGLSLIEVERRAEDHGYRLRAKEISGDEPLLEYESLLHGREGRMSFSFSPLNGKLYAVTVAWDSSEFGETLRRELTATYGEPRETIPGAGISIWTRRITELTLRAGHGRTILTYCHLLLKQEAREARSILQEKTERRSGIPSDEKQETKDETIFGE